MAKANKFGVFGGVFTPSILTILGVIMYLRLPWIVGQAGLLATLGIILVAHIISGSTGLSVASIATDKRVEAGGTYYIISRSLGLPIGGTLGWALFVGLSFSVSLYLIGFAEVFLGYFGFEVNLTTIRITGSIILFVVTVVTFISTSLAIKTQYIILTIMVLSLLSVFFGNHDYFPVVSQIGNLPDSLPWIALFAIFFPAVTGFEAGVSMSGDLENPRKAIPLGTISAILVGLAIYTGLAFFLSYTVSRDLLVNDPNVLFKISWIPQLVIAGILGATLSSALGSILGAPRIMQALGKDRISPFFFSKGFGASNEPRNALMLTFFIAQAGILIGDLNVIARIVTIFFIITYGFLNITYTVESWVSSDFRPSFKIPRFVSIIGAIACIVVMIQLDILALAGASLVLLALFFYLKNKELRLQTGDTRSSIWLSLVKTGLLKLAKTETAGRNWRPNVILFSGGAHNRPHLIEIAKTLVGKLGIFTNFELIEQADETLLFDRTAKVSRETIGDYKDIVTRKHVCRDVYEGIAMISRVYGFSGFEPNTILMGWAKNTSETQKLEKLLVTLNRLGYNLTFLNYDNDAGFGKYKRIDFWWSGKGRNLALALHLIRFITVTPEWRNAEIRILAIDPNGRNLEKYHSILGQTLDNYRIRANIKVINNVEKINEKDLISTESSGTDLTIAELPGFAENKSDTIVSYANELTGKLKSCLLIHASSTFEEINVSPQSSLQNPDNPVINHINIQGKSILKELPFSKTDIINNEAYNLAQQFNKHFNTLIGSSLLDIPEGRNSFLNHLKESAGKIAEKIIAANNIENPQKREWEYLTILIDYSFQAQKQLEAYIANSLPDEKEKIQKGFSLFITEIDKSLNLLPRYIRLKYSKEDYLNLKPVSLAGKSDKGIKILLLSTFRKKINYKIKLHPAARYYLYYKQLSYLMQFYKDFSAQTISAFAGFKEIITLNYEMIENTQSNKFSGTEIPAAENNIKDIAEELISKNNDFVNSQSQGMFDKLTADMESFIKIIESPQANYLSRKFTSFHKKSTYLEDQLSQFPDQWAHFMNDHVNRSYIDFMVTTLKYRLLLKIQKAHQDFEMLVERAILKDLMSLKDQVKSISEKNETGKDKSIPFSEESILLTYTEDIFNNLIKEIHSTVADLPESVVITGNISLAEVPFEKVENLDEYIVSVRKTADFYISNELCDQVRKQSMDVRQQLLNSISTIKDLIRLTSFNINQEKYTLADDAENEKSLEQNRILSESILQSIIKEEDKLFRIHKDLKAGFSDALKNALEPLSSVVIIKTSINLNKKIRDTEKRRFANWLQKARVIVSNSVISQLVKLLYSKSEGLLWAGRLEQSREKSLLFPGEPIIKVLEEISPDRTMMQQLPFYYANLFSGKSSLSEGLWVGMEEEIEKGSKAIKKFLSGTPGMIIITGERSSGKSSLSKHIASLHFEKQNTFIVKAPKESIPDIKLFEQKLLNALGGNESLEFSMDMLPPGSVIIIDDLELWWQRKPSGTQVVDKIISLLQEYSHKVLFIVNVNKFALKIINQLCSINSWAIDLVFCQPLNAHEIKELILIRHKAGGMDFILNKKHEKEMTNLDYARLFNSFFNLSSGNPGYALNLWLAGIKKITGNTLIMDKPSDKAVSFPENLPKDEIIYILQFILHRRFSLGSLTELLQSDFESTDKIVRILLQKGIVIEKFPEVFALNPALEILLVKKLKSLELL
ncbi:MAG: hypothetical protein A2X03_14870 [Bacteroidetes bacterium GWA2_40_15]|nr:MAG: hypothetical protein A2X03_14870 [Bacteroidetes bacterium GWA2_40_15]HBQ82423.1 hypothetical protein [Bacteroidales bacterium]